LLFSYFFELLIASVLISSFIFLFRPNVASLVIGGSAVAFFAVMVELYLQHLTSGMFVLLIGAPIIEENLKLMGTVHGKSVSNAIGVGAGFAMVENAFYLSVVFSSFSITAALAYVIARGIGDPLLHSSATSISVKTWGGSKSALPKAIGLHFAYNLWAVVLVSSPVLFKFEPAILIALLLFLLHKTGYLKILKIRMQKWMTGQETAA
jgi:RsiW-degrading membrane proteinase PrsW (M82 family)